MLSVEGQWPMVTASLVQCLLAWRSSSQTSSKRQAASLKRRIAQREEVQHATYSIRLAAQSTGWNIPYRSEGMSSRGISSLSAKRRGLTRFRRFRVVVSRSRRHPTFLFMKNVGIMIWGSSGSPQKRNLVPDLFPRLLQAISATKRSCSEEDLKSQKSQTTKSPKWARESTTRPETLPG